ncbi:pre-mRNA cleavage and polyadenylation factor Clp1 [Spraguea lophii 42_110]|uniref:Polynucleotide 5'-hydroxyl-kinase GRC3 n=1 Tax=Spraguea lophii (strain 42_110) TaxID=1358809 RepID=S7W9B3_SPRLO|nr:pre-mRNA cleavage and polyadenylation factor Clp1 [Spraguea lophii 42_110]
MKVSTIIELPPFHELRFEVSSSQILSLKLLSGTCEIKGQELLDTKSYDIKNINSFIFTYHGCKMQLEGECNLYYITKNSNILKIFSKFNEYINENKNVLVLGNGRSTFMTILANYFVRIHKDINLIELDVEKGFLVFPGVLGKVNIKKSIDFEYGIQYNDPNFYFYGESVINNIEKYTEMIENINDIRSENKMKLFLGNNNLENINLVLEKCKIDEIIVLGDERLYNYIEFKNKTFIMNSGYYKDKIKIENKIYEYFHGKKDEYTPFTVNISNFKVFKIGEDFVAPSSALPLGAKRKLSTNNIKEVQVVKDSVLGISPSENEEEIKTGSVIGFCVVYTEGNSIKVLAPQKQINFKHFIQSGIKYTE